MLDNFNSGRKAKAGPRPSVARGRLQPLPVTVCHAAKPEPQTGRAKGWSLRLQGEQRLELSLTGRAKAGAFRLQGEQRLEPSLTGRAKAGAFRLQGEQRLELSLSQGEQRLEVSLTDLLLRARIPGSRRSASRVRRRTRSRRWLLTSNVSLLTFHSPSLRAQLT